VLLAELDVREGGRYRIAFTTADGERHEVGGVYQEVLRPRRLSFSWAWQSTPDRESLVTLQLEPAGAATRLVFRHQRFFDAAARDNHQRGWAGAFAKLDAYMKSRSAD